MKNSVGNSRITTRVGRCARPTGIGEDSHVESVPDHSDFFSAGEEFGADALSYRNAWKKSVDIASGARSALSPVVSGSPLNGAISLGQGRTKRAGHARHMVGSRP
jgi:hypothetical protein